ncbi:MAG: ankyrin repeat domain-containing protein [Leptospiraceae bacterium]|nr:ankyrin repeat domain-containing protein [Leptospiraceae bacterium]
MRVGFLILFFLFLTIFFFFITSLLATESFLRFCEVKTNPKLKQAIDEKEDSFGLSLLSYCILKGQTGQVDWLLKQNADRESLAYNWWTHIFWASLNGEYASVRLLLQAGVSVNIKGDDGKTPLHLACLGLHESLFIDFLKTNPSLQLLPEFIKKSIHHGEKENYFWIIRSLLVKGANPDIPDEKGLSVLDLAKQIEDLELLKILEESTKL